MTDPSDHDLLRAAREDPEAVGVFYDRHEQAVLTYLRRRTGSAEVAADLAAETFAKVVLACRRGKVPEAPLPWLYAIAAHELATYFRRGRAAERARRRLGLERVEVTDASLERIEALAAATRAERLPAALAELPEQERSALLARHALDRDYSEIAADQQITEQAARKRVSRALARLRNRLGEQP